jgi:N-acetyl-gamma-glutamyl-phosphate reductase
MKQPNVRVTVIGGAGFTGGELLRLLLSHPGVTIASVHSRSHAKEPVHAVHHDLLGETALEFSDSYIVEADLWMLCLGAGESRMLLETMQLPDEIRIIDLSQDFRLGETYGNRTFIYGLPELNRQQIRSARNIANPGCFATAITLGLLPLAAAGMLREVHVTGITGSTGAGQKILETSQFHWRANNVNAYKTLAHQHLPEIIRALGVLQPGFTGPVNFVPWRGSFTRGIFVTSYLDCEMDLAAAGNLFRDYYKDHPFIQISDRMVDIKQVVNTNRVLIHLEKTAGKLIIHSVEDNLIKGASGQAVQNLNLMSGFEETEGLKLKSVVF